MSVAFRRETDDEHLEPKFEIPIAPGPNLVTPRGLRLLGEKVAEVEATIAAETDTAQRDMLKRDLRYWHTRQTTAEPAPTPEDDTVGIGSRVTIRIGGKTRTIEIVGGDEADPASDRIGFQAPLARALIGGEIGERVDFNGVAGSVEIIDTAPIGDA